jgi:hypothetical protein
LGGSALFDKWTSSIALQKLRRQTCRMTQEYDWLGVLKWCAVVTHCQAVVDAKSSTFKTQFFPELAGGMD